MKALRFMLWLVLLAVVGCDERSPAPRDAAQEADAGRGDVADDLARDAAQDAGRDATLDGVPNDAADAGRDTGLDAPDATRDVLEDLVVRGLDFSWRPLDECVLAAPDGALDAGPPCVPGRRVACTCDDGAAGARFCRADGTWSWCRCEDGDAGRPDVADATAPAVTQARLIAPQSGARTTTRRPTFRWVAPPEAARARVEVCDDRPCTRVIAAQETAASTWRPSMLLRPGPTFWRVRALDADGGVRWTSATWVFGAPRRDTAVDASFGSIRDANGDGYDDLVVLIRGDGEFDTNVVTPDTIQVYFGGADGLNPSRVQVLRPLATGGNLGGYEKLLATGDVNGDGLMDIAVPEASAVLGEAPFLPRVYVYFGTRGAAPCGFTRHWADYPIEYSNILSGPVFDVEDSRAVSVGDYDGDGFGDLLITTSRDSTQLHRGSPDGPLRAPSHFSSLYGDHAGFVGDVNADGYADFVAMNNARDRDGTGPIYAVYGNARARFDGFVQALASPCSIVPCGFGYRARGGDLDADGYSDAIITGTGFAWVLPGSRSGLRPPIELNEPPMGMGSGGTAAVVFGSHLSAPGDLDGDGRLEFAIGSPRAPFVRDGLMDYPGPGQVFLYRGSREGVPAAPWSTISAERDVEYAGRVSSLGDYNGDGYDDFAIAAAPRVGPEVIVGRTRDTLRVYLGASDFRGVMSAPPIMVLGDVVTSVRLD